MLRPKHFLANRQRALVKGHGLTVAALVPVKHRQVAHADGSQEMFRPLHLLVDGNSSLIEGLSLPVAALVEVKRRQVAKASGGIRVLRTQYLLADHHNLLPQPCRLSIRPLGLQDLRLANQILHLGSGRRLSWLALHQPGACTHSLSDHWPLDPRVVANAKARERQRKQSEQATQAHCPFSSCPSAGHTPVAEKKHHQPNLPLKTSRLMPPIA